MNWNERKGGLKDFHGNVKQQSESKNSFISMTRSWNLFMYSLSEWTIKVHRLAHERWEPAWGLCQHRWRLLCSYPVVDILLSVPHWDPLIKHWKNISSFRAKDKTNQRCFGRKSTLSNLNIIMFNNAQCFSAFCQYIVSVTIIHPEVVSLKFWIVPLIYWIFPRSQLFFFNRWHLHCSFHWV